MEQESELRTSFNSRNTKNSCYDLVDVTTHQGYVFLSLSPLGYHVSYPVKIFFPMRDNEKILGELSIGDKVEFSKCVDSRNGYEVRQIFFENEPAAISVSDFKYWKPNVVSMVGYERLKRPQTRFVQRPG